MHTPVGPPDRIVALGASAGGLQPLINIMAELPPDFPGHVIAVLHRRGKGALPKILNRTGPLPVSEAVDGLALQRGHVSASRGDGHVTVKDMSLRVSEAFPQDRYVPSVDRLFTSLATSTVPVIGVILSGAMQDGLAGALALHQGGHRMIVQDPDEAQFGSMPQALIRRDHPGHVLPMSQIATALAA